MILRQNKIAMNDNKHAYNPIWATLFICSYVENWLQI